MCTKVKNVVTEFSYNKTKQIYSGKCKSCIRIQGKEASETRHDHNAACKECGEFENTNPRELGRDVCCKCRCKKSRKAIKEVIQITSHRKCSKCMKIIENQYMLTDQNKCKACDKIDRAATAEKNKIKLESTDLGTLKICNICEKKKPIGQFRLRLDNYKFRNECIDCNVAKMRMLFTEFNLRTFVENPEEFKRNKAEYMVKWRKENPEKCKKMDKDFKNCISSKIKYTRNYIGVHGRTCQFSDNEITELITSNCFYCDIEPSMFGDDDYCGIDRVDNSKDYTRDNVVPACTRCNFIKGGLSPDILFKHIENIVCGTENDIKFDYSPKSFIIYGHSAIKKSKEFYLTKDVFNKITKDRCYICRNERYNGIDRVDNSIGYIISNCKSCCSTCNFMKKDLDLEIFLGHLRVMYNVMKHYTFKDIGETRIHQQNIINKEVSEIFKHETKKKLQVRIKQTELTKNEDLEIHYLGNSFKSLNL